MEILKDIYDHIGPRPWCKIEGGANKPEQQEAIDIAKDLSNIYSTLTNISEDLVELVASDPRQEIDPDQY